MPRVTPIPCLQDNYAYLVEGSEPGLCAVVDPSEYGPVKRALDARGLRVGAVLATHHHFDHVGGVHELSQAFPEAPVVALEPDAGKIEGVTRAVSDGERFELAGLRVRSLHIPGHTLGAVAYVVEGSPLAVFTGDTLFLSGCGRLFEGTAAQMHRSLGEVLGALPDDSEIYCGHEYTEANLRFAIHVEPDNQAAHRRLAAVGERRKRGEPTVPGTLADERATNPFLRVDQPAVRAFAGAADAPPAEVFARVRAAKDTFKG